MLLLLFKIIRKQELLGNLPQRVDNMAWCRPPLHWVLQETSLSLHLVLRICKLIFRTFSFSPKVSWQRCLILEKQMHNMYMKKYGEKKYKPHFSKTASTTLLSPLCCHVQMSLTKLVTLVISFLKFTWCWITSRTKTPTTTILATSKFSKSGACNTILRSYLIGLVCGKQLDRSFLKEPVELSRTVCNIGTWAEQHKQF